MSRDSRGERIYKKRIRKRNKSYSWFVICVDLSANNGGVTEIV